MQDRDRIDLTLAPDELQLVVTALTMLLKAEDDPATIEQLKELVPRLEAVAKAQGSSRHHEIPGTAEDRAGH